MKQRRLISMLLMSALVVTILAHCVPALASTVPSQWAVSEMNDANTSGLLTANAAKDFQRALSRDEFCELVVIMAERMLGRELAVPAENPFTDSYSIHVQKAYNYGVIYGVGGGKFDPDSKVERQQLCAMMVRAIKKLETDTGKSYLQPGAPLPFKDNGNIADYAVDSVKQAYASSIMLGDDTGNFNPAAAITAEQCVAVVVRSLNKMQKTYAEGRTDAHIVDMAYDRLQIGFAYGDIDAGVSRDIVLTTIGAGGAEITWSSNNESVISSEGVVVAGASPVTVTLTAKITYDTASRDKVFTLTTTPLSGERLLLENAYKALEITYFKSGDGPNSVTGRINLPTSVLGLPVTWLSSSAGVINTSGVVTVPSGSNVITVTLTAYIKSDLELKQKDFVLKVNNPAYANRGVSLYGVEMGMTQTQVSQVLGSPKRSLHTASNEIWNVYHTDYKNFVAVAFIGDKAVAVYSSAADASQKLLDASNQPLTTAQANGFSGVSALSLTDSGNSNREYAIMIYNPSSLIRSSRSLHSDAQEQLLLELVNAYRGSSNQAALVWNSYLGTAARYHTNEMLSYNYLDVNSRSGLSLKDRAANQGYEASLFAGGNVLGGAVDAVEFLDNMINTTAMRGEILGNNNTVFGAGLLSGGTGQYKTYLTYMTGTLRGITAISSNPATVSVDAGKTQNVSLVTTPTNANEGIRWSSTNTSVMTLSGTEGAKSVTVTGVSAGSASIVVSCLSSGNTYYVPVTVGVTYATALSLKYGNTVLEENVSEPENSTNKVLLSSGETLQLTSVTTPASGPMVTWSSSNTNVATVSSSGLVTSKNGATGIVTITAKVTGESGIFTKYVTIYVDAMTLKNGSTTMLQGENLKLSKSGNAVIAPELVWFTNADYEWTSSNINVATVSNTIPGADGKDIKTKDAEITAKGVGTATITVTAKGSDLSSGTIKRSFTVTVTEQELASSMKVLPEKLALEIGQSSMLYAEIHPASVENNKITWTSSNTKIATVDQNGNVTAISEGSATIFAQIMGEDGLLTEDVEVTVSKKTIPLTGLSITGSDTAVEGDEKTYTVVYTPSNTTDSVTWWVDGDEVTPTGNTIKVKFAAGKNMVVITVVSKNNPSMVATKAVVVSKKS